MITLANLKTYLKITDTSQDDQLNLAISNAKGFLEAYIWYSLELDAAKVAVFHWYSSSFDLNNVNINSVSKIEYDDDEFNPSWTEYADTNNFNVYADAWLIKTRDKIWPIVQITYSFWYDDTTCPVDLKAVLYDLAATSFKNMWELWMSDLKAETVDSDSVTFKDIAWGLSANAKIILDKYKNYGFSA